MKRNNLANSWGEEGAMKCYEDHVMPMKIVHFLCLNAVVCAIVFNVTCNDEYLPSTL